jgi:3-oxoacyl-[acyl-carrier-protein] synthase-3
MNIDQISLLDIDYCDPDHFLSSDDMEKELSPIYEKLKLPVGRIEMQTGIKSRGVFENKKPSDIATMAANKLFNNDIVQKEDVDLLIHASVCRDFLEPSTASVVHSNLELRSDCISFDLSNACLGVMNAITVASQMIISGSIKKALIVTGENATPLITKTIETLLCDKNLTRKSIKKYFANFTIGSAGVALVISSKQKDSPVFMHSISLSDTKAHTLCQGDGGMDGLVMETDSEALMHRGVALAKNNWNHFCDISNQYDWDHYICHQVGIHHQLHLYKELNLQQEKDYSSYQIYGNTGSAALPLTLALACKKDKIFQKGDEVALLGIGSGLHTIMTGLKWN